MEEILFKMRKYLISEIPSNLLNSKARFKTSTFVLIQKEDLKISFSICWKMCLNECYNVANSHNQQADITMET